MNSKALCQETDAQIGKLKEGLIKSYLQRGGQGFREINKTWMQFQGKGRK